MADLENWSPQRVKEALDNAEIVLIDVRTPQEYMFEHIDRALLMPMAFFDPMGLPTQGSKRIVLHCGSGIRSAKVAQSAMAAGVLPLAHMEGGFGAWKTAKLPYRGTDIGSGAPKLMNTE